MVIILGFHLCTPEVAPKRLGFEEISSFPKILETDMGCSGIFPLGAFFFALLGCATPRGEVGGFSRVRVGLLGCGLFVGVWGRVGRAWGVWRAGDEGGGWWV